MLQKEEKLKKVLKDVQEKMIDNDFVWAANNKSRIISEWRKRFDTKTEVK